MKRILITGANKGIGFATAVALLEQRPDVVVLLCSRDAQRGQAALEDIAARNSEWASRTELLQLDVADSTSVHAARESITARFAAEMTPLFGIVNNAGIGFHSDDLQATLNVNTLGVKRVCDALLPLLAEGGRIVNVSSAAAPNFVSGCATERRTFFQDASLEWSDIQGLIDAVASAGGDSQRLQALGVNEFNPYGFSKACVSLYTLVLARQHPEFGINACTPGFIETDLTRPVAQARGMAPSELGMAPPQQGTTAILHLLFGQLSGNGHYYGSDAKRSPLDRYRAPGSAEYCGD
ncbi:MAG: SDR family NAD(P)-dependent oxidoreductase [Halioglobus sp.]